MGTYLSAPVLDKHTERGSDLDDANTPVRWAVVDMQGWRKSHEDAHVARTDVPLPSFSSGINPTGGSESDGCGSKVGGDNKIINNGASSSSSLPQHAKVFAVFDGHGGAEVARFCSLYLVPMLISRSHWQGITGCSSSSTTTNNSNTSIKNDTNDNDNIASCVAQALIDTFHELDRLIDDPDWRPEIGKWGAERPPPYVPGGDGRDVRISFEMRGGGGELTSTHDDDGDVDMDAQRCRQTVTDESEFSTEDSEIDDDEGATDFMDESGDGGNSNGGNNSQEEQDEAIGAEKGDGIKGMFNGIVANTLKPSSMIEEESDDDEVFEDSLCEGAADITGGLENEASDGIVHDDDSDDGDAANTTGNDGDGVPLVGTVSTTTAAVAASGVGVCKEKSSGMIHLRNDTLSLLQKFLGMSGSDNENDGAKLDNKDDEVKKEEDTASSVKMNIMESSGAYKEEDDCGGKNNVVIPTKTQLLNPPIGIVPVSASVPTRIHNGRKVRSRLCTELLLLFFTTSPSFPLYSFHRHFRFATCQITQFMPDAQAS